MIDEMKIISGLKCCAGTYYESWETAGCDNCPYLYENSPSSETCHALLAVDVLSFIENQRKETIINAPD